MPRGGQTIGRAGSRAHPRSRIGLAELAGEGEKRLSPAAAIQPRVLQCGICRQDVDLLTKAHLRRHGMSKGDYLAQHPEHDHPRFWGAMARDHRDRR